MIIEYEIRQTRDGRIFGIKNIRQKVKRVRNKDIVTFIADIAGDIEAGKQYLKDLTKAITNPFREKEKK